MEKWNGGIPTYSGSSALYIIVLEGDGGAHVNVCDTGRKKTSMMP